MRMIYCKETCVQAGLEIWTEYHQYKLVDANPDGVQICDNYNVKRNLTWKEYRKYFWDNVYAGYGKPADKIHVIIEVKDGIVQNIYASTNNVYAEVYDLDAEESSEEELEKIIESEKLKKI